MIDSNETLAYESGRDAGYAEGYEDGINLNVNKIDLHPTEAVVLKFNFNDYQLDFIESVFNLVTILEQSSFSVFGNCLIISRYSSNTKYKYSAKLRIPLASCELNLKGLLSTLFVKKFFSLEFQKSTLNSISLYLSMCLTTSKTSFPSPSLIDLYNIGILVANSDLLGV